MAKWHFRRTGSRVWALAITLAVSAPVPLCADPVPKDYTDAKPKDLGIELIAAKKDPKTGFVTGGKNSTERIKRLKEINGIAIADLEKAMRPGALSQAGFLGKDERLLDVMATDNELVGGALGLTHQELARHLHVLGAIGRKEREAFTYHGVRFKVKVVFSDGYQDSPFKDGTRTNVEATVSNLDNGKGLTFSLLVPSMIERYGFYEGKGTSYRVDPRKTVEVLTFLKKKKE